MERSTDAVNFVQIGSVKAAGNSSTKLMYNFEDIEPLSGISYYRLRCEDIDGSVTYSGIISLNYNKDELQFVIYPNPNKGSFNIDFSGLVNIHDLGIRIIDAKGALIYENNFTLNGKDSLTEKIELKDNFTPGVYTGIIYFEGIRRSVRIIVD